MKETLWQAEDYHNHSTPQFSAAHELLSTIRFKGDEHILDIGCGSGATTASIAQKVPQGIVFALDASEDMIKKAQTVYSKFDNLSFFHMNAENFHFEQQFDLVTSFSCLHWIKNKQSTLNCVYSSLKNAGKFLSLFSLKQKKDTPLMQSFIEICISEKWKTRIPIKAPSSETIRSLFYQQFYPEDEEGFRTILFNSGFKTLKLIPTERKLLFSNKKDFSDWLAAWAVGLPFIGSLPPNDRSNFISDTIDRYLTYIPNNKNKAIEYIDHILVVHAQK